MFDTCSATSTPQERRRAMRPFFVFFLIFMVFNYALTLSKPTRDSALAWTLALATGLSMMGMLLGGAIALARQRDEFQRKLLTQSMIWGTGGMLAITTIWGLLEVHTRIPELNILYNFPIFLTITAIAKVTLFRSNPAGQE